MVEGGRKDFYKKNEGEKDYINEREMEESY